MNRREFLAQSLAFSFVPASKPPNVLYVFSDEHRACSLPGEPLNEAVAPNLSAFARESFSFRNCISNYPVCSPYRGILLTGRWPYQTGIIDNDLPLQTTELSIGETFRRSGYYTGYIGKWHLSSDDEIFIPEGPHRQGFQDWHVWARTNPHFDKSFTFDPNTGRKLQPKGYNCTLMTDMALEFIREPRQKPWMLMLSWNPPHPPFNDAPPQEMKRYSPHTLKLRPNVKLGAAHGAALESTEKLQHSLAGYYGHITAVDAEFGRIVRCLEETGQAKNTIVIYTSDHGEMMGSHGYMGKRLPHEESCKVPFFIRYPGIVPAGRSSEILFSTVDIYPSLCGLAGISVPSHCVGRDLSAAIRGQQVAKPESVFLMHIQKKNATGGEENPAPLFRGVRTSRHTYAIANDGRWCLYDNAEDPYQVRNLIGDGGRSRLCRELDGLLLDWMRKASDPFPHESLRRRRSTLSE